MNDYRRERPIAGRSLFLQMNMRILRFMPFLALMLAVIPSCHPDNPSGEDDDTPIVESISVEPTATKLGIGKTLQLTVSILPEKAKDATLRWKSSNSSAASVSSTGLVEGRSEGETTITVLAGEKSATCKVYVIRDYIPVMSLNILSEMDIEEGREYAINPVILPRDATGTNLTWKSSDESVATVRNQGIVKGVAFGEAVITATTTDGTNISANCTVRVHKPGPYNEVRYKSIDQKVVTPYAPKSLGTVVSNEYGFEWGIITLKDDLFNIGGSAFQDCVLLTEVALPARVGSIGPSAFRNCSSLLFINIPDEVTSIGNEAFYLCESLTSITLPDALKEVGSGVFSRCPALGYIHSPLSPDGRCLVLDGSVVAFAPAGLTSYSVPDGITGIRFSAFKYCQELDTITIPSSVKEIGEYAFLNCKNLSSVILLGTAPPTLGSNVFENVNSLYKVYVPASALDTYKKASGWSRIASHIEAIAE